MGGRGCDTARVLVAMSGGVDSSVAAAILKHDGWEVAGITLDLGETSREAVAAAELVARRLGIPHQVLSVRGQFEAAVVRPFCAAYLGGQTPNPCVWCNEKVKLERLRTRAAELGYAFVSTGHYARVLGAVRKGRSLLWRAVQAEKDQSYVLYRLSQEQLGHLLLPLGNLSKSQVRRIARAAGLPVAARPESQDICFISGGDYRGFLYERLGEAVFRPGPVIDQSGQVLGEHAGVAFFTIGQRKGLPVRRPGPWYVVDIRPEEAAVVVGRADQVWGTVLEAEDARFIPFDWPADTIEVEAQIRYRGPAVPARVTPLETGRVKVEFTVPQRAITPGQAVVFYRGEMVVGGATIVGRLHSN